MTKVIVASVIMASITIMASVTYGKCYLWKMYNDKCNYGKCNMANVTEPTVWVRKPDMKPLRGMW